MYFEMRAYFMRVKIKIYSYCMDVFGVHWFIFAIGKKKIKTGNLKLL